MLKVIIDADTYENEGKPHYILVDVETGKCMYLACDMTVEEEEKNWNLPAGSDEDNAPFKSIYRLHRDLRESELPIKYAGILGEFETIAEAMRAARMNNLLE